MAQLCTLAGFSSLAKEIRLKIWKLALPEPRVVTLVFGHRQRELSPGAEIAEIFVQYNSKDTSFSTALLEVCQESHFVFLQNYQQPNVQVPAGEIDLSELGPKMKDVSNYELYHDGWLDPIRDILHFDPKELGCFLRSINSTMVISGLRTIAIPAEFHFYVKTAFTEFGKKGLPDLQNMIIVMKGIELDMSHVLFDRRPQESMLSIISDPNHTFGGHNYFQAFLNIYQKHWEKEFDPEYRVHHSGAYIAIDILNEDIGEPWVFFKSQNVRLRCILLALSEQAVQQFRYDEGVVPAEFARS